MEEGIILQLVVKHPLLWNRWFTVMRSGVRVEIIKNVSTLSIIPLAPLFPLYYLMTKQLNASSLHLLSFIACCSLSSVTGFTVMRQDSSIEIRFLNKV